MNTPFVASPGCLRCSRYAARRHTALRITSWPSARLPSGAAGRSRPVAACRNGAKRGGTTPWPSRTGKPDACPAGRRRRHDRRSLSQAPEATAWSVDWVKDGELAQKRPGLTVTMPACCLTWACPSVTALRCCAVPAPRAMPPGAGADRARRTRMTASVG